MYSNIIDPELFFLFLINTFNPIFSLIEFSKNFKFESFVLLNDSFFILKIFTKFSDCLTESFFSIIFFATKLAFSKPTKILACPCVKFLVSINIKTSLGKVNNLKQLAM